MDYDALGKQYLAESATIQQRAALLRKAKQFPGDSRGNMLTDMYLELRAVGNELLKRGR